MRKYILVILILFPSIYVAGQDLSSLEFFADKEIINWVAMNICYIQIEIDTLVIGI